MGFLNRPKNPKIPGFDTFPNTLHTARWPEGFKVNPTDRVGVIGTGSSGLQIVGAISPIVKEGRMTVFMRTRGLAVGLGESGRRAHGFFWVRSDVHSAGSDASEV